MMVAMMPAVPMMMMMVTMMTWLFIMLLIGSEMGGQGEDRNSGDGGNKDYFLHEGERGID